MGEKNDQQEFTKKVTAQQEQENQNPCQRETIRSPEDEEPQTE